MTVRTTLTAIAGVLAAFAASAALAGTANDPKTLVLQPADFPAGTHSAPESSVSGGPRGKFFTAHFNFRVGSGEEEVTSYVSVSKNAGDAATVYRLTVAGNSGVPNEKVLQLPAYGDEQFANFVSVPGAGRARGIVVVRRNAVVWSVEVESCGVFSPSSCYFLGAALPPKMPEARALVELKKYAPKQKARVGSG